MSDEGFQQDKEFTANLVEKILKAAGNQPPIILLPVNYATLRRVHERIDSMEASDHQKEAWRSALALIPVTRAGRHTWQQDYMQSYVDLKTGKISLRGIRAGLKADVMTDVIQKFDKASGRCEFKAGAELINEFIRVNGQKGGNIESLPGGICLLGSDHFAKDEYYDGFAKKACGSSSSDRIKVPTSWLETGHTDEVVKVLRDSNKKAPCDFSLAVASSKVAIELLQKAPDEPFLQFPARQNEPAEKMLVRRYREDDRLRQICMSALEYRDPSHTPANSPSKTVSKLLALLMNSAQAVDEAQEAPGADRCAKLTNRDVAKAFTSDPKLQKQIDLVQDQMNKFKSEMLLKLKAKLPQCNPTVIDIPTIFTTGELIENKNGKTELPFGMAMAALPNPTNSILISRTIITPDAGNSAFKNYLVREYEKIGLSTEFIDSFDYAHQGNGNLHCVTNTIPICRPKK